MLINWEFMAFLVKKNKLCFNKILGIWFDQELKVNMRVILMMELMDLCHGNREKSDINILNLILKIILINITIFR
jgi:hypothetical protein